MVKVHTGQFAPKSGQYRPLGFVKVEITLTKGEKTPPYKGEARTFILEDATKHQKNK